MGTGNGRAGLFLNNVAGVKGYRKGTRDPGCWFSAANTLRKSVAYHFLCVLYIDLMFPKSQKGYCIYSIDRLS